MVHAESLEQLAEVLRLADGCPAGTTGDELRRAACELIEATSSQRDGRRRHILTLIARAEWRHGHGHQRDNEPSLAALHALSVAVLAPA